MAGAGAGAWRTTTGPVGGGVPLLSEQARGGALVDGSRADCAG
jgi:hypothetical protein